MIIKSKADIKTFLISFSLLSEWDGSKFFFTVEDPNHPGTITYIQYPDGKTTFHRKNELFWDLKEQPIIERDIWRNRRILNKHLKGVSLTK